MIRSGFDCVKFEMSIGPPRGHVEQAVEYTSLEFRREVQSGYKFGNYQQSIGI